MPRPKQRTPELRDRVLAAAVRAVETDGRSGFTARRVAHDAGTSVPAVYELFGDKAGLTRAVFFHGFSQLHSALQAADAAPARSRGAAKVTPRVRLEAMVAALRGFAGARPALAELMFSRPVASFSPSSDDLAASGAVRQHIVGLVRACLEAGLIEGNAVDVAHIVLAVAQGLALQESGGWLGSSAASADRRWQLALKALLDGLAPKQRTSRRARAPE